jgi:hypothetical protein
MGWFWGIDWMFSWNLVKPASKKFLVSCCYFSIKENQIVEVKKSCPQRDGLTAAMLHKFKL